MAHNKHTTTTRAQATHAHDLNERALGALHITLSCSLERPTQRNHTGELPSSMPHKRFCFGGQEWAARSTSLTGATTDFGSPPSRHDISTLRPIPPMLVLCAVGISCSHVVGCTRKEGDIVWNRTRPKQQNHQQQTTSRTASSSTPSPPTPDTPPTTHVLLAAYASARSITLLVRTAASFQPLRSHSSSEYLFALWTQQQHACCGQHT